MSGTGTARRWRLVRARPDAVPASVRKFNRRANQRRMRAAVPWAVATGVLVIVGVVAWLVYGTAVLGVSRVRVSGTTILTPLEVRDTAGIRPGTPLARVDLAAVTRRVSALAPVARVEVLRDWPSTIRIAVVERTAVAVIPHEAAFILLDGSGMGYHTVDKRPPELPVVRLSAPRPDDPTTRSALTVLAALTPQLRTNLAELIAEAPARIRLLLRDKRIVVWGDSTESDVKAQVATVLLSRATKQVDVSAPEVATVR